ncbi:MAG: hypothetical protein M1835_005225 [Candelina submexicana]|nr:MAG: hypothetical protein M1835_005225 [Candelina submexicana]
MEAYPADYLTHNLPFIVLSGLGSAESLSLVDSAGSSYPVLSHDAIVIESGSPPLTSHSADQLLRCFLELDVSNAAWNGRPRRGRMELAGYYIKAVGRKYEVPPRKTSRLHASPSLSPILDDARTTHSSSQASHSPLSPLSPGSPIFPDGVLTPSWLRKHQDIFPSTFITFHEVTSDAHVNTLHDNQLKIELNNLRKSLGLAAPRTRFVVVLLGEKPLLDPEIDERLTSIRRGTSLVNTTSLFYLAKDLSLVDIQSFALSVVSALQPTCIDYYRDLSKHARRKKSRGIIPPPTSPPIRGTSQTLAMQGWNVRYSFKAAVFAEFRQEMVAAGRDYEVAYEGLLGQDVIGSVASWSPRFNEARLLADVIAIRILRCLLWNGQTTAAVQSWRSHRDRIRHLVDRQGKGSATYGWKAWEARWSRVMAEIIQKSDLPLFSEDHTSMDTEAALRYPSAIYSPPEKAVLFGERLPPFSFLHHPGYWFAQSAGCLFARRALAEHIPEEHRMAPGQSPASQVSSRSYTYDTYLCPEPHVEYPLPGQEGVDHSKLRRDVLTLAVRHFEQRSQRRFVDRLLLDIAREYSRSYRWKDSLNILRPLWENMTWRQDGWWSIVEEVDWLLCECASQCGDGESIIAVNLELMSNVFVPMSGRQYDLNRCLNGLQPLSSRPKIELAAGDVSSCLHAIHAFKTAEDHVGEPVSCQLSIHSSAHNGSEPITLSEITLAYRGRVEAVVLRHKVTAPALRPIAQTVLVNLDLAYEEKYAGPPTDQSSFGCESKDTPPLVGYADLRILPGHEKVFGFVLVFREAGEVKAHNTTLTIDQDLFRLDYTVGHDNEGGNAIWWVNDGGDMKAKRLVRGHPSLVKILPRLPKMHFKIPTSVDQYYTDEHVSIKLELFNGEDEQAEASLETRLLGQSRDTPQVSWRQHSSRPEAVASAHIDENEGGTAGVLPGYQIGTLLPSHSVIGTVNFQAGPNPIDYVLELKVLYHLVSDKETPVSKTLPLSISIVRPFLANYDFSPQLHPDAWPSLFLLSSNQGEEHCGIAQLWGLTARVASFATQNLIIEGLDLPILAASGGFGCEVVRTGGDGIESRSIPPRGSQETQFLLDVKKLSIDDRRSAVLDVALSIRWRRDSSGSSLNTSCLSVPRLLIPSGEPRVLASAEYSARGPSIVDLVYTLENPSMHFLTFSLTMEASEEFAFSGPKFTTIQLVPLSRRTVRFKLMPYPTTHGRWIQPQLHVVDRYFQKSLEITITGGSETIKMGEKGMLVWIEKGT